jgi:hypothetical protein
VFLAAASLKRNESLLEQEKTGQGPSISGLQFDLLADTINVHLFWISLPQEIRHLENWQTTNDYHGEQLRVRVELLSFKPSNRYLYTNQVADSPRHN